MYDYAARDKRRLAACHPASLPAEVVDGAIESVRERRRRARAKEWVSSVRSAYRSVLEAGVEPDIYAIEEEVGVGAYSFVMRTFDLSLEDAIEERLRETEPEPEGLADWLTFDGTVVELEAHNSAVRGQAAAEKRASCHKRAVLRIPVARMHRPRERGAVSCPRPRGSRRNLMRSSSRGGDSGDSEDGGESGDSDSAPPLERQETAGATR